MITIPTVWDLKSERISFLKGLSRTANQLSEENKNAGPASSKWEREVIANNIVQLKAFILQFNKDLHPTEVTKYATLKFNNYNAYPDPSTLQHYALITVQKIKEECLYMEIARFSLKYSIVHDLYWITDGMVKEHIEIAMGEKAPDSLEVHCSSKIEFIEDEVLPYMNTNADYVSSGKMLTEIISNFNQNSFLTTNILLPVVIENMVRTLAKVVFLNQNPEKKIEDAEKHVNNFMSIETLILKGGWQNDIPIGFYDAVLKSKYIADSQLADANKLFEDFNTVKLEVFKLIQPLKDLILDSSISQEEKITASRRINEQSILLLEPFNGVEKKPVLVSLKVKFQFLIRKFKDDRNHVIHGQFADLNKKWKCYINFSALIKTWELIKLLDKQYCLKDKKM